MTDRLTDHTTRSVTIGGTHSGEAKFCYCLRLQQVFIGAVDSTDRINFSNQQLLYIRFDERCNTTITKLLYGSQIGATLRFIKKLQSLLLTCAKKDYTC